MAAQKHTENNQKHMQSKNQIHNVRLTLSTLKINCTGKVQFSCFQMCCKSTRDRSNEHIPLLLALRRVQWVAKAPAFKRAVKARVIEVMSKSHDYFWWCVCIAQNTQYDILIL